jgi:hypothetical protein
MYLKGNSTALSVSSRLVSPNYPDTSGSCIRWYMILGDGATLRVRTFAFGALNPMILYTLQGSYGSNWKLAQATIRSGSPFQVVFDGLMNNTAGDTNTIAIDDVEVRSGICDELGTCDFERGLCGFQPMKADFNWKRTAFNVETYSSPQLDHTTNSRAGLFLSPNHNHKLVVFSFLLIRFLRVVGSSLFKERSSSSY